MKNKFWFLFILIVLVVVSGAVAYGFYSHTNKTALPLACTMEAKICPDGTAVGREGPNCEFKACPVVKIQLSGIKGIAMLGPMCPVERIPPDLACADRPYKTDLVATSPDGTKIFQQFSSDTNGNFSVDLAPGEYTISSAGTAGIFSHCSSQGKIKVEKSKYTNITLNCDTGIR